MFAFEVNSDIYLRQKISLEEKHSFSGDGKESRFPGVSSIAISLGWALGTPKNVNSSDELKD